MNPKYPIYIPSKGRWKSALTIKCFQRLNIPFYLVIEKEEYENYIQIVEAQSILVLPFSDKGLVPARNWIWDHAASSKTERFWTFDDNIRDLYRLNKNKEYRVKSGTILKVIEDFVNRYENIAIAGMQYELFTPSRRRCNPFILNTRVYSNMLIKTDIPYRNRGFFNDDTDLCLRVLKDGWCTVLFCSFLIDKMATMRLTGGLTSHYQGDGRLKMAQSLKAQHPDVVKIVWKWNRWQHSVDYRPFKKNKLILKKGVIIQKGIDNYGMVLRKQKRG